MHIDAIPFAIPCIGEMDLFEHVAAHRDYRGIPVLALIGEFEPIFAQKAAGTRATACRSHFNDGNRLIQKLQLSLPASLSCVGYGQLSCPRACPP